jgi:hypothetical protein
MRRSAVSVGLYDLLRLSRCDGCADARWTGDGQVLLAPVAVQSSSLGERLPICNLGVAVRGAVMSRPRNTQTGVLPSIPPLDPLFRRFEERPPHIRTLFFSQIFEFPLRTRSSIAFEYCAHPFGLQLGSSSTGPPPSRLWTADLQIPSCPSCTIYIQVK